MIFLWNAPYPKIFDSGFRKCIWFGWPGPRLEVIACQKSKTLCQFSSEGSAIESAWTHRVSLIFDTATFRRQILKWGSTSTGHNAALNTTYPLCHTYSEPPGYEDSPHQVASKIYNGCIKNWANCNWVFCFWANFGDFCGWEPRLYRETSDFHLSVLGDLYAFNYPVCHRYT